jgi:hypothetical protein
MAVRVGGDGVVVATGDGEVGTTLAVADTAEVEVGAALAATVEGATGAGPVVLPQAASTKHIVTAAITRALFTTRPV